MASSSIPSFVKSGMVLTTKHFSLLEIVGVIVLFSGSNESALLLEPSTGL